MDNLETIQQLLDQMLTADQAAKIIGIDPAHVRRLCLGKELHSLRIGKGSSHIFWLIDPESAAQYRDRPQGGKGKPRGSKKAEET